MMMRYSKTGLSLTEKFEGCRLSAYQDQVGVWTIGYGHTRNVHKGDTCTQEQAEQWLLADIALAEDDVNTHVLLPELTQGEFDALVDFAFNLGCDALNKSTLLRLLNHNDKAHAALEFEKWDHAGGKVVAGLLRRRLEEKQMFLGDEEKER
jgi:lysozyme